tara:strand:- start:370 stop:1023 length:654 start_codon:yes stop_codon:yes gene_type:complete
VEDNVNSKVIGAMLILGPLLTVLPWIALGSDTSGMAPSEQITAILAEAGTVEATSILNVFGGIFMFAGLYFLARSLKSENTVSNHFAEIGGLLLLVSLPIWVALMGTDISAIDAAKEHGNEVGATIIAASKGLQMVGVLLVVGLFLLGVSLTLLRKYKGIIGILFIIASVCAFIDMVIGADNAAFDIISMIGWMGMFLITLVTGILTTLQKENQPEA